MEYKYSNIKGAVIAAALDVHKELGCGFPEVIYQRSLEFEMLLRQINFDREISIPVYYKLKEVGVRRVDFLVENLVPIELKASARLEDVHLAQALNYLEAFNLEVGLLINFGGKSLEVKRLYNSKFKLVSGSNQ